MKLFAVYIGGEIQGANIEVHDMRFVVGDAIEGTYEELRRQWWGVPSSLHLDCWSELMQADGYKIMLKPEPFKGQEKLYYVNLGGYDPNDFSELHKNIFVVSESEAKAKVKALKTVRHWHTFHKDDQYDVDQVLSVQSHTGVVSLHIHLEKIEDESPAHFICAYKNIAKKS